MFPRRQARVSPSKSRDPDPLLAAGAVGLLLLKTPVVRCLWASGADRHLGSHALCPLQALGAETDGVHHALCPLFYAVKSVDRRQSACQCGLVPKATIEKGRCLRRGDPGGRRKAGKVTALCNIRQLN